MGRHKKQEFNYNQMAQAELIEKLRKEYLAGATMADLSRQYKLSNLKLRKLLVTAGVYDSPQYKAVRKLYEMGFSEKEIMKESGLSKSTVNSYLPYSRGSYCLDRLPDGTCKEDNCSLEAKRCRRYRQRKIMQKNLNDVFLNRS